MQDSSSVLAEYRGPVWEDPVVLASYCAPSEERWIADRKQQPPSLADRSTAHHHSRSLVSGVPRPVEARLMDYQRAHDARMLALRQDRHHQNDDGEFTGTPRVNRRSAALAQKRSAGVAVHDRLSGQPVNPPPAPAPSLEGDRSIPKINKRSSDMAHRGVESQFEWENARQRRHEAKRQEQAAKLQQECNGRPHIDEGSRKMAQRFNTYDDPMQLMLRVEDRLLRHQEMQDSRIDALRRDQGASNRRLLDASGTPRKQMKNKEEAEAAAAARLFNDAEERRRAAEERARQEEILGMIDKNGGLLYRPQISPGTMRSPAASNRRGSVDVFTYLANQQHLSHDGANGSQTNTEGAANNTGRPHIGAYSVLLANLARPHDVDTFERLAKNNKGGDDAMGTKIDGNFKPAVDRRSDQIDRERRGEIKDRIQFLYQRQAAYDAHRRRMQQEKEDAAACEEREFRRLRTARHGNVTVGSDSTGGGGAGRCVTPDATYQRMKAWSSRNENKLNALRVAAKDDEVRECTFEPSLLRKRAATPPAGLSTATVRRTPKKHS